MTENHIIQASKYKMSQAFGQQVDTTIDPNQQDNISCMKFDRTGDYLAIGDHDGRIIIFKDYGAQSNIIKNEKNPQHQYEYHTQFISHQAQINALTSQKIDQKVINLHWMRRQENYLKLFTLNGNSIRLWKIYEKCHKKVSRSSGKALIMPKLTPVQTYLDAKIQINFPNVHKRQINTIGLTNNQEYILSSDNKKIILTNIEKFSKPLILLENQKKSQNNGKKNDKKKTKQKRISIEQQNAQKPQYITTFTMHPQSDSIFFYGTNKGTLKLCDMRSSLIQQNYSILFKSETTGIKNFFTDFIQSISSICLLDSFKYVATRNLLSIKIWDIVMPSKPIAQIPVHENMKSKLFEIYYNECIQDKFNLSASSNGTTLFTGSFNSTFHLFDVNYQKIVDVSQYQKKYSGNQIYEENTCHTLTDLPSKTVQYSNFQYEVNGKNTKVKQLIPKKAPYLTELNYQRKVLVGDFHPKSNLIAMGLQNNFYVYQLS